MKKVRFLHVMVIFTVCMSFVAIQATAMPIAAGPQYGKGQSYIEWFHDTAFYKWWVS